MTVHCYFFFFSSRRRHTRFDCDWSSDVCSSDLLLLEPRDPPAQVRERHQATRVRRAPRVFAGSRVPGVGPRNVAAYGEAPRATSHSLSGPALPPGPTKASGCDPTGEATPAATVPR